MSLQKRDYKRAMVVWKDLQKRCPKDATIAGFAECLPAEAKAQEEQDDEDEYYDEEEDEEDYGSEKSSSEESEDEPVDPEEVKAEEERKKKELEELGDPGSGYEWASDVDSNGRPIWGEEGVDFEFYYEEDR